MRRTLAYKVRQANARNRANSLAGCCYTQSNMEGPRTILSELGTHIVLFQQPGWWSRPLIYGGWIGVDLFFVLSGFLVSGLLFREHLTHQRIEVGSFLARRGLKIYPGFYVLIAVSVLASVAMHRALSAAGVLSEVFFVQNYRRGLWPHTWSLAVEEHF